MTLRPALTRLFVVLSKEPDKYQPGKGEYQDPHYLCGIRREHGNWQRQGEEHR
jgi:hypothetical protein